MFILSVYTPTNIWLPVSLSEMLHSLLYKAVMLNDKMLSTRLRHAIWSIWWLTIKLLSFQIRTNHWLDLLENAHLKPEFDQWLWPSTSNVRLFYRLVIDYDSEDVTGSTKSRSFLFKVPLLHLQRCRMLALSAEIWEPQVSVEWENYIFFFLEFKN